MTTTKRIWRVSIKVQDTSYTNDFDFKTYDEAVQFATDTVHAYYMNDNIDPTWKLDTSRRDGLRFVYEADSEDFEVSIRQCLNIT